MKWTDNVLIQCKACQVLCSAALHNKPFVESAKNWGCLDAVAWTMRVFPDELMVQVAGNGTLAQLLSNKENADYVVNSLDGIELIVASMKKFPNDNRTSSKNQWRKLVSIKFSWTPRKIIKTRTCKPAFAAPL